MQAVHKHSTTVLQTLRTDPRNVGGKSYTRAEYLPRGFHHPGVGNHTRPTSPKVCSCHGNLLRHWDNEWTVPPSSVSSKRPAVTPVAFVDTSTRAFSAAAAFLVRTLRPGRSEARKGPGGTPPRHSQRLNQNESGPWRPPGPRPAALSRGTEPVSGSLGRERPRPRRGDGCGERRPRGAWRGARGQHPPGQGRGAPTRSAGPGTAASQPSAGSLRSARRRSRPRGGRGDYLAARGPIRAAAGSLAPCRAAAVLPRSSSSQRCHYPSRSPLAPRPSPAPPLRVGVRWGQAAQPLCRAAPAPLPHPQHRGPPVTSTPPRPLPTDRRMDGGDGLRRAVTFRPRSPIGGDKFGTAHATASAGGLNTLQRGGRAPHGACLLGLPRTRCASIGDGALSVHARHDPVWGAGAGPYAARNGVGVGRGRWKRYFAIDSPSLHKLFGTGKSTAVPESRPSPLQKNCRHSSYRISRQRICNCIPSEGKDRS